jgi:hypothetical protein
MSQRYEAVAVRKFEQNGETKSAFTNIGVAFQMRDRDGYSLRLHCLPAPVDGEYQILLFPPKPKDERQTSRQDGGSYGRQESAGGGRPSGRDLDDEIPF